MKHIEYLRESVSTNFEDNLKFILQASDYNDISDNVRDILNDLCDELDNSYYNFVSALYMKYKRSKRSVEKDIRLTYFVNMKGELNPSLSESDKRYLADFLNLAEWATSMHNRFRIEIQTSDMDGDKILKEIQNCLHLLRSNGYDAKASKYKDALNEITDGQLKEYINEQLRQLKIWMENGNPYKLSFYIFLKQDIDTNLFKPGNEYISKIPKNVLDDFKTFCDRLKLVSVDREELANLIQKSHQSN